MEFTLFRIHLFEIGGAGLILSEKTRQYQKGRGYFSIFLNYTFFSVCKKSLSAFSLQYNLL